MLRQRCKVGVLNTKMPICMKCINYMKYLSCKAFPGGIPKEILDGKFDHTKKFPGQGNEILFEAKEK